jgi:hypothetical protein
MSSAWRYVPDILRLRPEAIKLVGDQALKSRLR